MSKQRAETSRKALSRAAFVSIGLLVIVLNDIASPELASSNKGTSRPVLSMRGPPQSVH